MKIILLSFFIASSMFSVLQIKELSSEPTSIQQQYKVIEMLSRLDQRVSLLESNLTKHEAEQATYPTNLAILELKVDGIRDVAIYLLLLLISLMGTTVFAIFKWFTQIKMVKEHLTDTETVINDKLNSLLEGK